MIFALLIPYGGQLTGTWRRDSNSLKYAVVFETITESRNCFVACDSDR